MKRNIQFNRLTAIDPISIDLKIFTPRMVLEKKLIEVKVIIYDISKSNLSSISAQSTKEFNEEDLPNQHEKYNMRHIICLKNIFIVSEDDCQ